MTMMIDDEDDDRQYAALEAEMSEPVEDGSDDGWTGSSGSDDGDSGEYRAPEREHEASATDDEEIERASLQADEYEYQQRASYGQQQERPSIYDDPIAHVREIQQEMQAQRSQREYQQFLGTIEQHENAFKAMTPDYHDAAEYLEKARKSELNRLYPDNSPQAHVLARQHGYATPAKLREAVFINDAQTVARQALQMGKNPAAVYYELASDRGFRGKGSTRSGGRSSGGRSGGRSSGNPSTAKLLDLYTDNPEEFDKQWDRMQKTGVLG
jgi:hypothetical protein